MKELKSRVYILTDNDNRVIRLEGEYSLPQNLDGWILIEEGTPCDRLNLAQSHYLDKPLMDERGIYRYKYVDGEVVERLQAEMDADCVEPIAVPTQLDRVECQVLYTALMTDTLLEEE